jgi:hypothetical protein
MTVDARYSRARALFRNAVETLAVHRGGIRERLQAVDKELFVLPPMQVPDALQDDYNALRAACTRLGPQAGEGSINATFRRSKFSTLVRIAQNIVDLRETFADPGC